MNKLFKIAAIFCTCLFATGCFKTPNADIPNENFGPKFDDSALREFMAKNHTCEKPEDSQNIPSELLANAILVGGIQKIGTVEQLDCSGEIVTSVVAPFTLQKEIIEIEPPEGLAEKVQVVEVTNDRGCSKYRISTQQGPLDDIKVDMPEQGVHIDLKAKDLVALSQADDSGKMLLLASTTAWIEDLPETKVIKGKNLIKIQYFAECQDRADGSYLKSQECENPRVLANKAVVIDWQITPKQVDEVRQESICEKK
jgi:hypothetical protein